MSIEEASENFEFNIIGLLSVASTFIIGLLNGTLLKVFPQINLPEMNIHDAITISLSVLSAFFVIVKIANGILSFIHKRRIMKEEKAFQDKFKKRDSDKK